MKPIYRTALKYSSENCAKMLLFIEYYSKEIMAGFNLFEFKNYKLYLSQALERRAETKKGQKYKMASSIGCHPGYLSKVFNEHYDLSPEQAEGANQFLGHTPEESRYFLNLVMWARAGTPGLKTYFEDELKKQRHERQQIKNRISVNRTLDEQSQAKYYSSWHFSAVHVAVSLEHMQTPEQIAENLHLPLTTINKTLEFLIEIGLLKKSRGKYEQGETNLFLNKESSFITQHHTNWRVQALRSLDEPQKMDLHYSSIVTCAQGDIEKLREVFLNAVQEIHNKVKDSEKSEAFYCYTIDLFNLEKNR